MKNVCHLYVLPFIFLALPFKYVGSLETDNWFILVIKHFLKLSESINYSINYMNLFQEHSYLLLMNRLWKIRYIPFKSIRFLVTNKISRKLLTLLTWDKNEWAWFLNLRKISKIELVYISRNSSVLKGLTNQSYFFIFHWQVNVIAEILLSHNFSELLSYKSVI